MAQPTRDQETIQDDWWKDARAWRSELPQGLLQPSVTKRADVENKVVSIVPFPTHRKHTALLYRLARPSLPPKPACASSHQAPPGSLLWTL